MRNKKDVIVKKRKREKVKTESRIKPGKTVGIIMAIGMVVLFCALLFLFRNRHDGEWNVIVMRDGEVRSDRSAEIELLRGSEENNWELIITLDLGDRKTLYEYDFGSSIELFDAGATHGETYMTYNGTVAGMTRAGHIMDNRSILADGDLEILLIAPSTVDLYNYVAYKGTPEEGAAALEELDRYWGIESMGVTANPFE